MPPLFQKIAIIGPGLIGGSLAKAAKGKGLFGHVTGISRNEENLKKGLKLGVIDTYTTDLREGIHSAELVVVATPPSVIVETIEKIAPHLNDGCIITDVGSVKEEIVKSVETFIPKGIHFVGGHPIAGTENSGIDAAISTLFVGHKCILTPSSSTNRNALDKVKVMWEQVGCQVILMDVEYHDKTFAAVSHLPHIIAFALINGIMGLNDSEAKLTYSAGGLKDFTRIAASHPIMWKDISLMNRNNLLNSIVSFQSSLDVIKTAIAEGDSERLVSEFTKAREVRRSIQ